jgi:hypothetical protein
MNSTGKMIHLRTNSDHAKNVIKSLLPSKVHFLKIIVEERGELNRDTRRIVHIYFFK